MAKRAMDMVNEAKQRVAAASVDEVAAGLESGDVVLVDVREPHEREKDGSIPGAVHAPRGMLEFYADATTPYQREEFDPDGRIVFHCGSGSRAALAADTLLRMGYSNVAYLKGGITAWKEADWPVE